jgi:hypothetical protein
MTTTWSASYSVSVSVSAKSSATRSHPHLLERWRSFGAREARYHALVFTAGFVCGLRNGGLPFSISHVPCLIKQPVRRLRVGAVGRWVGLDS